jgi:hypothetical protein
MSGSQTACRTTCAYGTWCASVVTATFSTRVALGTRRVHLPADLVQVKAEAVERRPLPVRERVPEGLLIGRDRRNGVGYG